MLPFFLKADGLIDYSVDNTNAVSVTGTMAKSFSPGPKTSKGRREIPCPRQFGFDVHFLVRRSQ
jgi:hypothetical protein